MKSSLVRIRHARSKKDFPFLPLEEGEYVELAIFRSKVGLILIWVVVLIALVLLGFTLATAIGALSRSVMLNSKTMLYFWVFTACLALVCLGLGLIASRIYLGNKLYVTNRRLIHHKVDSLFTKSVNIIELKRIEDVSFKQNGLFDHLFSMGTIRLSTVGDETTYTFKYVDTPEDEIELIAHLVHNQKGK